MAKDVLKTDKDEPKPSYTEKEALKAIRVSANALHKFQEKQTSKMCLAAVQQKGDTLRFVKKQTEPICLAAVKQDGDALQFADEQTKDVCLAAVNQNGNALAHVKEQTLTICLAAVMQDSDSKRYVNASIREDLSESTKE